MKIRTLGRVHRLLYEAYHKRRTGIGYREFSGVQFSGGHVQWALIHGLLRHKLGGKYHINRQGVEVLMALEQVDAFPINHLLEPATCSELAEDPRFHCYVLRDGERQRYFIPGALSAKRGYHIVRIIPGMIYGHIRKNKRWVEYFRNKRW